MAVMSCIIIGAGVSGLLMVQRLRAAFGDQVEIRVFEKNADVGGTWFENRYPGCACDVPSHIYQYSFAPNPYWSRIFASSSEIQQYLVKFAEHYHLKQHITFNSAVSSAKWDEIRSVWTVTVEGSQYECDVLLNAGGILNNPNYPRLKGLEVYRGLILHTAAWDPTSDLSGKRVAIIGAGASAIQLLPAVHPHIAHADVYIRTPSWITQLAAVGEIEGNRNYTDDEIRKYVEDEEYSLTQRKGMEDYYNGMWKTFQKDSDEQKNFKQKLETRMNQTIKDEHLRKKLIPDFEAGCRRLNPGEPYLETIQKDNVQPLFDPIDEVTPSGIVSGGEERKVDAIILATGFDTSFRPRFPIIGVGGQNLQDLWKHDPVSYFGVAVSGYPNYLMFLGPNTPISNGSLMGVLEATADYFIRLLEKKLKDRVATFDVFPQAQADFDSHTQEYMKGMVWTGSCRSWYKATKLAGLQPFGQEVRCITERFASWKNGLSTIETGEDPITKDLSYYILRSPNLPPALFGAAAPPENRASGGCSPVTSDDDSAENAKRMASERGFEISATQKRSSVNERIQILRSWLKRALD